MNHLFIIGNGFDLAHGLRTRYSDFLAFTLSTTINDVLAKTNNMPNQNSLFKVKMPQSVSNEVHSKLLNNPFLIYDNEFLMDYDLFDNTQVSVNNSLLSNDPNDLLWVDFEKNYFNKVVDIINTTKSIELKKKYIEKINLELDSIKIAFSKYIKGIEFNDGTTTIIEIETIINRIIKNEFRKWFQTNEKIEILSKKGEIPFSNRPIYFNVLNFNYTTTYVRYFTNLNFDKDPEHYFNFINIHGLTRQLNWNNESLKSEDELRKITLGYGDEFGPEYHSLLEFGEPKLARNFKSFSYLLSDQYSKLIAFIDSGDFEIHVMGHSLGKSDKVLLREIFENDHCKKIYMYYKDKEDYISKVFNAASIFEKPDIMRRKIAHFEECRPLSK